MTGAAQWWDAPPAHRVSLLPDVDPELLAVALDPLPPGAPAVLRVHGLPGRTAGEQVAALLTELDRAALALFPSWLPGADRLDGPHPLGAAAVRSLAAAAAARSAAFGPFLTDLAGRALAARSGPPAGSRHAGRSRFPAEVRAAGLARVLADAYRRTGVVLLVEVPDGLTAEGERVLAASAEWLAGHGRFTVWLAGRPLRTVDRVPVVTVTLPHEVRAVAEPAAGGGPAPTGALVSCPPLSGLPRADSPAEQTLERALSRHGWAYGRRWNHTWQGHPLGPAYRLDLCWLAEGLAVEVDGPEHRGRVRFADDRRRDVHLQLLGYDVLRFTNDQVLTDVPAVLGSIRDLLATRRAAGPHHEEKRHHADH
ncbi:endonuclease domain-containing protein [Micromonospora siamensis]|nr:DUF559 domain-containing protein [Micromonospora siamensis]